MRSTSFKSSDNYNTSKAVTVFDNKEDT